MVFNVRDRFDLARPVIRANSSSELGASLAMTCSSSRLPADRTLANDSVEVNQTFGSSAAMRRAPRATAIVRHLISLYLPIPTFSAAMGIILFHATIVP